MAQETEVHRAKLAQKAALEKEKRESGRSQQQSGRSQVQSARQSVDTLADGAGLKLPPSKQGRGAPA